MPQRRVHRLPALLGPFGAALAIVGVLSVAPLAVPNSHAQDGPDLDIMGQRAAAPRGPAGSSGIVVPGQTQACRYAPGALANYQTFFGPYPTPSIDPFGFPVYASYNTPPFGGVWGFYAGVGGQICAWQPH